MSNPEDNPDKSDGKEIQPTGPETNTQSQAETTLKFRNPGNDQKP